MKKLFLSLAARAARLLPMPVKQALYRLGPLSGLLRGALNRAAPVGLSVVRVAAGELTGITLRLDLQSEKDYWLGTYEAELQAALRDLVRPGDVAYDVGANIGYISLMLARAVGAGGRVFAFEALPSNQERLRANLALNPEIANVTVAAKAVSGGPGEIEFHVHASGGMGKAAGSAGRQEDYQETIRVAATSLDDFVYEQGNPAPQIIKLDIEGGEVLALPGMRRLLAESRPTLLVELHGPESARAV
ncbi:MAG: FkbM family methyltransferase, partial [Anaerolineae bacterium]|nr:FkbM family methyltransferase [Anaerolineae bacterium]